MFKKHPLLLLTMVGLAVSIGGCVDPAPYAIRLDRPTPTSAATDGNIKGIVHGKEGPGQPVGMAFVTTGSVSAIAANPQADQVEEDVDNNKAKAYVMKDFGGGTPVLVERRKREKPGGPNWQDKYVYLKPGEFLLEGVPEGIATLTASYGGVNSQQTLVEVYKGNTRVDIKIPLYIPGPVQIPGPSQPNVVDFVSANPTSIAWLNLDHASSPPTTDVTLKAPPGSAGTVIKGFKLTYTWDTVGGPPGETDPFVLPISPIVVAPAQDLAYGPPSRLTVPISAAPIQTAFPKGDPPPLVVCTVVFIDENGFEVLDNAFNPLKVEIVAKRQ
jgi:hypothetical protein